MTTQAYFEDIQPQIVKELEAAQRSIYVAVAWFTDNELLDILCQKARQQLTISVLILNDEINNGDYGLDFSELKQAGGEIYLIGSKDEMMHNKFCVIDNATTITGSYNWTRKAKINDENITITKESEALALDFIAEFNRLQQKYLNTSPAVDITTLLKRLEILKNTIAIQDDDDIEYQTGKLKKLKEQIFQQQQLNDISEVINHIKNKAYGDAMRLISDILQRYQSLTVWSDPEVQGLQLEIRALSLQISSLEDELADVEKTIHEFELRHTEELGDIILKLLSVRRILAARKVEEHPEDATAEEAYEEAKEEEQQYRDNVEEARQHTIQQLSPDEEKELKTKFRSITKLTHPDLVDKHFEKEAAELFIKAKEAKDRNDLATINDILDYLETGKPFKLKHETITETEQLRAETKRLRYTVELLLQKITAMKHSDTYQNIATIEDWNTYFSETKEKLQTELERLETLMYEQQGTN